MKLISLWEPWATLMAIGAKRIETRSWGTSYRGWLAIHASKGGLSKAQMARCLREPVFAKALEGYDLTPGHIVACVWIAECLPMEHRGYLPGVFERYPDLDTPQERAFGDFSAGRWAWVTVHPFRLQRPIPFKGRQGVAILTAHTEAEIHEQMRYMNKIVPRVAWPTPNDARI